jgi:L-seryl-tRNA(Ser) seleniumtransferase
MSDDPRRHLPSVERLLQEPAVAALVAVAPRPVVLAAVREALEAARHSRGGPPDNWADDVSERVARRGDLSLRRVLNATGVVIHTNLGRAPLARAAIEAVTNVADGYSTLEFDLAAGARLHRGEHCRSLLAELTGAEDALVVNNAASALVLALNAHAAGTEVVISRGELVEIGGAFRIPDILERSGARLREVGTTNRTYLEDYRAAIGPATGALLQVHRSNFEQVGFVHSATARELADLAHATQLPFIWDIGSGLLADLTPWGLDQEPRVPDAVAAGADLVIFSGDKLLGGPQAGCLVGTRAAIACCRTDPLVRAARADKLTLAALGATLELYREPEAALREIPVLRMLTMSADELHGRAGQLAAAIHARLPASPPPRLADGTSATGGGAFAAARLPTTLVCLEPGLEGAERMALALRLGEPAVVARVADGQVLLDPRTLPEAQFEVLADAIARALAD